VTVADVPVKDLVSKSRNETPERVPKPKPSKGLSRGRGNNTSTTDNLQGGRATVRTTDRWQFVGADATHKRPFGREEATIRALSTLRDLDPQASHAVYNYLRMVNPGNDLLAYTFDGEGNESKEQGAAQDYLDGLVRRIGGEYGGGLDQLHNVLSLSLVTTGAVCAEVAPTEDLNDTIDWYPVDPALISFQRDKTDTLIMGQRFRDGTFHPLNPNQVFYTPLDPDVDEPYGRPLLLPALSACLAKGQMINDLRAVAHNQGYPRLDISINWEAIHEAAPPDLRAPGQESLLKDWTESVLSQLVTDYESLQVDDTFVHYDWVDIGMVGGAAGVGAFDFAALEKILTRQVNNALKTLPILLGINETTSETHGSIQWQIQVQGVTALQRLVKRTIEKLANTSLQLAGYQAHAKVEYEKIRTVDRLFEAQADFFETRTVQLQEMMGWRSHDEAAELITKHEAAGPILNTDTPQPNLSTNSGGDTSQNLNTGANAETADTPTEKKTSPEGSDNPGAQAWQLLMEGSLPMESASVQGANSRWLAIRAERASKAAKPTLSNNKMDAISDKYVARTREIFQAAYFECVTLLSQEGYDFASQFVDPEDSWSGLIAQDVARDVSDYVFGVGYSREMKGLLRDAFREGMRQAGLDDTDVDYDIDDRLIERVWRSNRQFVLKLRSELHDSLVAQEFHSVADIKAWFDGREWREDLMGRFLAKQGVAAGYAYGMSIRNGGATFVWTTVGSGESCPTCLSRSGTSYSYDELVSIGFPGAIELECGANCRCSLTPE
jgi:hypothetical protein